MRVAPGTPSGRVLRIKGKGVARADGTHGDLLAKVQVVVPTELTDEVKAAVETLREQDGGDPRAELYSRAGD